MICLICRQAKILDGLTSVKFQRGEIHLVITHVPARVCPRCGEAYVAEEVAVRLLQSAEDSLNAGMLDAQYEYRAA
jgi:YgiT-type zinc finger domain-containing protein